MDLQKECNIISDQLNARNIGFIVMLTDIQQDEKDIEMKAGLNVPGHYAIPMLESLLNKLKQDENKK